MRNTDTVTDQELLDAIDNGTDFVCIDSMEQLAELWNFDTEAVDLP